MKKAERIQSADLLDRQAFFEYRHKKKKMSDLDMNEPAVVFSEKGMEMLASIIRDIVREEVRAVVRQEIQKLNSDPKDEDYDEEYEEFLVEKNRPKGCSLKIFQRALLVEDILRKHGELRLRDLLDQLAKHNIDFGINPTPNMNRLMEVNPNICRVRHGYYGVKEDKD